jgi:hypothetical protein
MQIVGLDPVTADALALWLAIETRLDFRTQTNPWPHSLHGHQNIAADDLSGQTGNTARRQGSGPDEGKV